ncbi:MAG: pilus assembly protein PilP [Deltaproteobacteria bacterium]|nr:pilus assembly protein PilP [Deltaproteobacteria bacterium]MBW2403685.1 pilus assembly protein PilP [Deltaproteobacteria bacterium]MBW2546070.1 pilus assembly protein PilP [Deltaproteobacteria bacterium]MBW2717805.1 pilus assembly protein PilP [Deltaproteobacteria bacterium]
MSSKIRIFGSLLLLAAVGVAGCGADEEEYHGLGLGAAADRDASGEGSGEGGAGQSAAQLDSGPAIYTDDDFSELDIQNRDPFRSFARAFKAQAAAPAQRRVLLPSTSLDEMQLIAIVTGIATPRAMLTDTAHVGHVIRRGDYIGRPEVVQTGGSEGMPVTLNWRVDRIRPGSVVLTREDPTSPDKPPLTRVMPLHEGGEAPQLTAP